MFTPSTAIFMSSLVTIFATLGHSLAQDYPSKPIRIVTLGFGGGNDFVSRLLAQGISNPLGQQVVVDNRGPVIPGEIVSKSPPDGYTLLVQGDSLYLEPLLRPKTTFPYEPAKDFAPVTLVSTEPNVLVVHPSLPVKTVKELIALAKARPGQLNYASNGTGSTAHLGGELFNVTARVKTVQIPYTGTGQALNALMAGEVDFRFAGAAGVLPHIKSGRLRPLGVTGSNPTPLVPAVPTVGSTLPGYMMVSMSGVFAPAKTPPAIINRLNQEMVRVINQPDVKSKLVNLGQDVVASTPEQLGNYMNSEIARMGKLIMSANIRAD